MTICILCLGGFMEKGGLRSHINWIFFNRLNLLNYGKAFTIAFMSLKWKSIFLLKLASDLLQFQAHCGKNVSQYIG